MARNNEAKVTFLAETKEFRENVSQASSKLTELRSELRLNAEQMKTNGVSADGLSDRHKLLQEQLKQAETKTQSLAAQMEACTRIYGANSTEAQKLATQINNARVAEEKIQQEIQKVNAQLASQATESRNTESALSKLQDTISEQEAELARLKSAYQNAALAYGSNSKEARGLASEIKTLSGELNDSRNKMSMVETAADNMDKTVREAGDGARDAEGGFTVLKGTLANLASTAISNVVSTIGDLGSTLWNLGDETREYRTEMGKLDAAFSASGFSAETASNTYRSLYGIIGETDQSVEAAQQIALLSNNTQDAAKWADLAAGVVGRFGDALQPETFYESANETLKLGEATGAYTQMLEGCGISVEAFNEGLAKCKTESEKQAYMLKVTNSALGEAGTAYKENNASIIAANTAQDKYNTALSGLGAIIEPIKTVFVNGMAHMLESVTALVAGIDTEKITDGIRTAFEFITGTVFPAIQTGIQWFIDNKDIVIAGIAGIVAGIAAFKVVSIVQTAVTAFKAFQAATTGLTLAQKALNLVMMANPIGLVVAAIAGLVTAFVLLWKNCEGFREFWIGLWDGIKNVASTAWEAIKGVFSGVGSWFSDIFSKAWNAVKNVWSTSIVGKYFGTVWDSIKKVFSVVKSVLTGNWRDAWNGIKSIVNTWKGFFSDTWSKIKGVFEPVGSWFKSKFSSAWNGVKNAWSGAKSYFSNTWSNIKGVFSPVGSWFKSKFSQAWSNIKGVFSGWGSFFDGLWSKIKGTFTGMGTKLGSAIGGSVTSALNKVFGWVESTLNKGIGLINSAIGLINKIPGVNVGKIGNVSLPRLASGGVLYGETAFVGGEYHGARTNPEIVTPQSIMRKTFEDTLNAHFDNTLNLDRMVAAIEKLASRTINIDIDSVRIAEATAGAADNVSGNRLNLRNRGLAL